jgi:hypothetical protein
MEMSHRPGRARESGEQGAALIVSLMAITLMMALGLALVLTTMTEGKIAGNHRAGVEALYAAGAAVDWAILDVLAVPDWDRILDGSVRSGLDEGPLAGARALDIRHATNLARCGKASACSDADMDAVTEDRPWGRNNPRWQLYAHGPLTDLLGSVGSPMYVAVWMADDPADSDDLPLVDGGAKAGCPSSEPTCVNVGKGVLAMRAHAYGRDGVVRIVEVTLARSDTGQPRVLTWRER